MVDFAKLRAITPAERAATDERIRLEEFAAERNRRAELSKKTIEITLTENAELRSTISGEKQVFLVGTNDKNQPTRALYVAPSFITDDTVQSVTASLVEGKTISLTGYWRKRQWKKSDGSAAISWEFQTMTIIDRS